VLLFLSKLGHLEFPLPILLVCGYGWPRLGQLVAHHVPLLALPMGEQANRGALLKIS
jgi:hypothetical protein